jgi:ABC-type Zn uptake system ZnuABC Zn-binding protein ZnuA
MLAKKTKGKNICFGFAAGFIFLTLTFPLSAAPAVKIAVTISPLADMAKRIAGEESEVITLMPPGANPHAFELTIKAVKELNDAQVAFMIGHGLDDWIGKAAQAGSKARALTVDEGIHLLGANPHYWLSVKNAKIMAQNMTRTLSELNPGEAQAYRERLEHYLIQLDGLDQKIKNLFSDLPAREIITFHDSWPYFASEYGLIILGNVESCQDQGPTPRRLANLSNLVRSRGAKILFSEPTAPKDMAQSVARDLGLKLYQLDPMGKPGQSLTDLIWENVRTIHEALKHG